MKGRLLAITAVIVATIVLAAEHRQVGSLRKEVDRLREEIARNQRARDIQPTLIVPVRGQDSSQGNQPMTVWPQPKRSPFRLIDSVSPAIEDGMKADEWEQKRRQREWFQRQQNPYAPEPLPAVPSWAEIE
jgi:hypothetical protein